MLASDETGRAEWAAKERELRSGEVSLLTAVLERVEASMAGGRAADVCMADRRLGCFRGDKVGGDEVEDRKSGVQGLLFI